MRWLFASYSWSNCSPISLTTTLVLLFMKTRTILLIFNLTVLKRSTYCAWITDIECRICYHLLIVCVEEKVKIVWGPMMNASFISRVSWQQMFNVQIIESFLYVQIYIRTSKTSEVMRADFESTWASYLWLQLFLISNHRFLCERSKKENKKCGWWLFDHLNPLLSTGSGACEKVKGHQCDNKDEGQKVEETKRIRRHSIFGQNC